MKMEKESQAEQGLYPFLGLLLIIFAGGVTGGILYKDWITNNAEAFNAFAHNLHNLFFH